MPQADLSVVITTAGRARRRSRILLTSREQRLKRAGKWQKRAKRRKDKENIDKKENLRWNREMDTARKLLASYRERYRNHPAFKGVFND